MKAKDRPTPDADCRESVSCFCEALLMEISELVGSALRCRPLIAGWVTELVAEGGREVV